MRRARGAHPTRLAVIGAGRAGLGLATCLAGSGYLLTGIVARSRTSASRASRIAGSGLGTTRAERPVREAEVVLLCVPDRAIADAVRSLSRHDLAGKAVLHTSGDLSEAPLSPLRRRGAAVGCLHPLWSFPEPGRRTVDLKGVAFAIDGDREACAAARAMVRALGGRPLRIPEAKRASYHLAASILANDLVALLDIGMDLAARRLRMSGRSAREIFLPLVRAAVENVSRSGPGRALTGPVVRGDISTIEHHLQAISGEDPGVQAVYRSLTCQCIRMARRERRITAGQADALARLLGCRSRHD